MLDDYKTENIEADSADVEKQQEALLINKLQAQGKNPPKSQSSFLQKKLQQRVSCIEKKWFIGSWDENIIISLKYFSLETKNA